MQIDGSIGAKNAWRLETPGSDGWSERVRAGNPNKYFMVSCDNHANEPKDLEEYWRENVAKENHHRLPRYETDAEGIQWLITEGWPPQMVRVPDDRRDLLPSKEEFESWDAVTPYSHRMEDEDVLRSASGRQVSQRIADRESQGVDAELVFAQKGSFSLTTPDSEFQAQMCRGYNRWARDYYAEDFDRTLPIAMISPGDVAQAVAEVEWVAANGFHGVMLPNRPIFQRIDQPLNKLNFNDKRFEPLWSALEAARLPITFHLGTGQDARTIHGDGAALTAYINTLITPMEPMVQMIASGVFERHPELRAGTIESGIGWVPWCLQQLDHCYRSQHMWVRPVIPNLPSDYYKRNCFSTFMEEPEAVPFAVEYGLEDNMLWAMDYPHHEGSFPHCAESIERQMNAISETQRAKLLGLNAKRIFNIVPRG
jgi:predicted TIM-barrel fold metal-dependent hydrolase